MTRHDPLDPLRILREVFKPQSVKFNLSQHLRELGGGIEPQGKAADKERLRFGQFLVGNRSFPDALDLGQDSLNGLVCRFSSRLKIDPE